jgi:hypothetical protein
VLSVKPGSSSPAPAAAESAMAGGVTCEAAICSRGVARLPMGRGGGFWAELRPSRRSPAPPLFRVQQGNSPRSNAALKQLSC